MAPKLTHGEYLALVEKAEDWRITGMALETARGEHASAGKALALVIGEAIGKGMSAQGLSDLLDVPEAQLAALLNQREQTSASSQDSNRSFPNQDRQDFLPRKSRRIWSMPRVTEFLRKFLQENPLTTEEIHAKLIELGAWSPDIKGERKAYDALHNYLTHYRGVFYLQEGERIRSARPYEVVSPLHVIQRAATKNGWLNAFEFAEEFTIGPNGGKLFYNYVMTTLNCLVRAGLIASVQPVDDHACYEIRPSNLGVLLQHIDNYTKLNAKEAERAKATLALQNLLHPGWYFRICEETQKAGKALPPNRHRNGRQS